MLILNCAFRATEEKPALFLIGDSTVSDKPLNGDPERGWGQLIPDYFDHSLKISNHAVNGRSTKSFITEGRWAKVLEQIHPNDWVMIQFGHNDEKKSDTSRYAAPQTDYRHNLIRFVKEARQKGAKPILITPVVRRKFDENGKIQDTHGEYPAVAKSVAAELQVPLIDLEQKSRDLLSQNGAEASKKFYLWYEAGYFPTRPQGIKDDTHFSEYGASNMAALVMNGLREINSDLFRYARKSAFQEKYAYELPKIITPVFRKDTFNILSFGAKSDGITLNTEAINKAITTCSKAGGGTVIIPEGFWLSGPIDLKSNVNLHLRKGVLLQFSNRFEDYPLIKTNWEGTEAIRCKSPVNGQDLENIAITGNGVIDGAGGTWRAVKKSKLTDSQWKDLIATGGLLSADKNTWYPSEKSFKGTTVDRPGVVAAGYNLQNSEEIKDYLRPNLLVFNHCTQVLLEGVTFQNSPAWCLHPLLCEHITLKNLTVRNPWFAQNGDGVDLESCRIGMIDQCTFDVGDDGICIKSGKDAEGRKRGVPTENIIVQNSTVFHAHGGFVIGSEMSGGVKNLFVSNCNFLGTDVGLRFKTARGRGGVVEKIYVNGINMTNIPGEAILFDMYYMGKDPVPQSGESNELPVMKTEPLSKGTPKFKDFYVRNVVCKGAETGILVRGLPEMSVSDILIENAFLQSKKGLVCIEGENIKFRNITLISQENTLMQVQNGRNIEFDGITFGSNTKVLLKIMGDRSGNINLLNTDTSKLGKEVEFGEKVQNSVFSKKK